MRHASTATAGGLAALFAATSIWGGGLGSAANLQVTNKSVVQTFSFVLDPPTPRERCAFILELDLSAIEKALRFRLCLALPLGVSLDTLESASESPVIDEQEVPEAGAPGTGKRRAPVPPQTDPADSGHGKHHAPEPKDDAPKPEQDPGGGTQSPGSTPDPKPEPKPEQPSAPADQTPPAQPGPGDGSDPAADQSETDATKAGTTGSAPVEPTAEESAP